MKFKTFCLLEASQEYNIAKTIADKLYKLLFEIEYSSDKDPKYLKKYKYSNSGMYEVPLNDFIKKEFPKDSVFSHLKDGKLYLEYGYEDNSPTPFLWAISSKDGRTTRTKAGAYFEPSKNFLGIHLPFINPKTDLPFKGLRSHWKSLLLHELTHYVQDVKDKFKEGTSTLSSEEWHQDKKEQEAYLHELYSLFQTWMASEIQELKSLRKDDIVKFTKKNNFLVKLFSTEEMFEQKYPIGEIFLDNDKQKKRINYIASNLKDVYKKFVHDTYEELKKEFKNVLPTKEFKYTQEEYVFVEYINKCLNESAKEFPKPDIINYVGKNGEDKKILSFDKVLSKITIFEVTDKKIVYGTDARRIVANIEQGADKQEQIDWETKIYNKEIKTYNEHIKDYYDRVYEYKFLGDVNDARKALNDKMKFIVGTYILLKELNK